MRSYSELIKIPSFRERYYYLKLDGSIGKETFGFDRYLNQVFYKTKEWNDFRRKIIIRDNGCDLGVDDGNHVIRGGIIIHHIEPISPDDILQRRMGILLNEDNAICVSKETHNAIHYGDESLLFLGLTERAPNDTCPWR